MRRSNLQEQPSVTNTSAVNRKGAPPQTGTRELIKRVATQLFYERGYHETSLAEIATRVGIRKASLYYHFPSKQDILRAVLKGCIEPAYVSLARIQASDLPASEKLRQAVRAQVLGLIANRKAVSIFFREAMELPSDALQEFIKYRDAYSELFESILVEGQRSGQFGEFDTHHAKLALLGMLNWLIFWYRPEGPSSAEMLADSFASLALRAVGACRQDHTDRSIRGQAISRGSY